MVYNILFSMVVTPQEKDLLAAYPLKDVAQAGYTRWRDDSLLRGGPVTWAIFKRNLLDRFFPREIREA